MLVDGWVCVALRVPRFHTKKLLPNALSNENLIVFCDEEGHPKQLPPTWPRPTDNWMLVGPVVFARYEKVWHDDGPDEQYYPLTSVQCADITSWLKNQGWRELVLDELDYTQEILFDGGKVGEV